LLELDTALTGSEVAVGFFDVSRRSARASPAAAAAAAAAVTTACLGLLVGPGLQGSTLLSMSSSSLSTSSVDSAVRLKLDPVVFSSC